jgi:HlyD family secretion protein
MKKGFILILLISILLSACSGSASSTPIPTVVLNSSTPAASGSGSAGVGSVAASGIVISAQNAQMAFTVGGLLEKVNVAEGDLVKAGQVLAELDNTAIQIDLGQSQRKLMELTSISTQAAAAKALAVARQTLKDAQDKFDSQTFKRASDTLISNTQGEIDLAKQALSRASDSYRLVSRLEDGDSRKAAALVAMTNAQMRLNNLIATYNWYTGTPTEIDAALATANLAAAKAAVQEAEWYLAALKGEAVPPNATGSNLANLKAAADAVASAQDRLDKSKLVAPISGTVITVKGVAGEMVSPGAIIVAISDVTHLRVETTDLSERNVPFVKVGQAVTVIVKALNQNVAGHVSRISPVADTIGGDVVYKTTIDLDNPPDGLLSGMSVDVQYQTGQ